MNERATLEASLDGRYDIERELGAGGMATVYLARDVRHDREVAVKVLHADLGAALGGERFLAEIKTTAKLQHPHILPLLDSGDAGGLLFYVMPVVSGESLRDRLDRERQLPISEAVRIAREVAAALDYAHRHGVIHRDIKPENILLHDGSAMVADFGIALAVQSASGPRMTQTGLSLGTPQYMSPEQAMGERQLDARVDIYALAAVTYEMLTGDPPFSGSSVQAIVARVMTERPTAPRVLRDTVPPQIEQAVLTGLAKLPADRFATAAEFGAALGEPDRLPTQAAPAVATSTRQRRLAVLLTTVATLALGLTAGFLVDRWWHPATSANVRYTQKTFDEQRIANARYAPDGKTIVYSTAGRDGLQLMVIRPDYPEPQSLGLPNTQLLSVSSLGELAVLTQPSRRNFIYYEGTLARVPLGGGAPRQLIDSVADADWSPDGAQLAIVRRTGGKERLEYPIGKVLAETSGWFTDIRIAPNGKSIAFANHPQFGDNRGTIDIVDLEGHRRTLTPEPFGGTLGLAWSRSGNEVFFSTHTTTHQMLVFGVTLGGTLREALNAPGDLTIHDVGPDGDWLVTRDVHASRVVFRQAGDSVPRPAGWLDYEFQAVVSRDGRQLAIGDATTESGRLYSVLLRSDTGGRTARLGDGWPEQFSRDGKWVVSIVPSDPARLTLYPTGPGSERRIPTPGMSVIDHAELMPDGASVLVCGHAADQASHCAAQSLDGTRSRPMPLMPRRSIPNDHTLISPDGLWMLTMQSDKLAVASTVDGAVRPVKGLDAGDNDIARWGPPGQGDALWVRHGVANRLDRLDPLTGNRTTVLASATGGLQGASGLSQIFADDPRIFAAVVSSNASELFAVSGVH